MNSNPKKRIMSILHRMDKSDPETRRLNKYDFAFYELTPIIHQCDEALSCANMYGHIGDAYIRNLQEISLEDNVELQCKL